VHNIVTKQVPPPSAVGFRPPKCFDSICLRALERNPDKRYQSGEDMAEALRVALERHHMRAPRNEIARWVRHTFRKEFAARREAIREHIQAPPGRVTLTSIEEVEERPGLTSGTMEASKMSDSDLLVPVRKRARAWQLPLVVGLGVALLGSVFGIWVFSRKDVSKAMLMPTPHAIVNAKTEAPTPATSTTSSAPAEPPAK